MNINFIKEVQSIFPLIHLAFSYRLRVRNIVQGILEKSNPNYDEEIYLRSHATKSALGIGVFHKITYSLGIEVTQNVELASFCISIIWTNLDKILDTLPPGDSRFAIIIQYYTELLTTGESTTCLPLKHPKFSELTILAKNFYAAILTLPRKGEVIKLITDLSFAVNEQRDSNPRDILDEQEELYKDIKNKINSTKASPQIQKAMFLASRLGVITVLLSFGISFYNRTNLSDEQFNFLRVLTSHAAYIQLLDDFLDREKDLKQGIYTYATQCSEGDLSKFGVLLNEWKQELEKSLGELGTPASNILLHGMRAYSILNRFGPKDNAKESPYGISLNETP